MCVIHVSKVNKTYELAKQILYFSEKISERVRQNQMTNECDEWTRTKPNKSDEWTRANKAEQVRRMNEDEAERVRRMNEDEQSQTRTTNKAERVCWVQRSRTSTTNAEVEARQIKLAFADL